jgi:hypothetical protein
MSGAVPSCMSLLLASEALPFFSELGDFFFLLWITKEFGGVNFHRYDVVTFLASLVLLYSAFPFGLFRAEVIVASVPEGLLHNGHAADFSSRIFLPFIDLLGPLIPL